ncbi:MAG TPA: glycosyltransferase [Desulfotomaculum sp.]|nr:glycosyltransferase [Desulfotomaculum sp.]
MFLICAVVPAQNEAGRIGRVVERLLKISVDAVIAVVNGSTDGTPEELTGFPPDRVHTLSFPETLGLDVPRVIGAACALKMGAAGVIFIDGDMAEVSLDALRRLKDAVTGGIDLALTDCYPPEAPPPDSPVTKRLLHLRKELNRCLGKPELGWASPAHGPHAASSRFLQTVPLRELSVPPVALCLGILAGLEVAVAAGIAHHKLGSPARGSLHSARIAATITGDCLEALSICRGLPRTRKQDAIFYDGYDSSRRRDIMESYLAALKNPGARPAIT